MDLGALITKAGLTQAQVAHLLGVSRSNVCRWVRGYADVPAHQHKPLAKHLGVDVRDIVVWGVNPRGKVTT